MVYVVTFENYDEYESYSVSASCIELAIMNAKDIATERHGSDFCYYDSDVLSVIRI
jgi:hypothetical protein